MKKIVLTLFLTINLLSSCEKNQKENTEKKEDTPKKENSEKQVTKEQNVESQEKQLIKEDKNNNIANWVGKYEFVSKAEGNMQAQTQIEIMADGKVKYLYSAKQAANDLNATLEIYDNDKAKVIFFSLGEMNMVVPNVENGDEIGTLTDKTKIGFTFTPKAIGGGEKIFLKKVEKFDSEN